jgi:bud emergence protein 1
MRVFKALRIGRRSIKGDEKGKPQISIPQKSAVAIVPPKKVRPPMLLNPKALCRAVWA